MESTRAAAVACLVALAGTARAQPLGGPAELAAERLRYGDYAGATAALEGTDPADPRVARLRADLAAAAVSPTPGPAPTDPALAVVFRAANMVADGVERHPELVDLLEPSLFSSPHRPTSAKARATFAFWVAHRMSLMIRDGEGVEVIGWTVPRATARTDREVTAEVVMVARGFHPGAQQPRPITVEVVVVGRGDRWRITAARPHVPPPPWYAPDTLSLDPPDLASIVDSFRRPPEPPRRRPWLRRLVIGIVSSLALTAIGAVVLLLRRRRDRETA